MIMMVIFWASHTPSTSLPNFGFWNTLVKKGGHALGYGLLALAYLRILAGRFKCAGWLALLLTLMYAISDEIHQYFTPGRNPSWMDVIVDLAGACLAVILWVKVARIKKVVAFGIPLRGVKRIKEDKT